MQEGNEVQTRLLVFRSGASHVTTPDGSSTLISPPTYHLLQPVVGTAASCQIARCSPASSTSNPSQSTETEVPTATATASENERSPTNPSQGALSSRGRTRMTKAQTTKKT